MFNNGTQFTMPVAPVSYSQGAGAGGGFGYGDGWVIWLFFILAIVWGGFGNGFGGFGGNGVNGAGFQGYATRADINEGFALNNITSGITAIQQGICDSTYALNNAITNGFQNQTIATMQGFNGVTAGQNAIQHQLSDCCCQTQRAIDGVNYNMATNTCALQNAISNSTRDIVEAGNANTRSILEFLTNSKIADLQNENQSLKLAASQQMQNAFFAANQEAQTAEIIRRLTPTTTATTTA